MEGSDILGEGYVIRGSSIHVLVGVSSQRFVWVVGSLGSGRLAGVSRSCGIEVPDGCHYFGVPCGSGSARVILSVLERHGSYRQVAAGGS